MRVTICDKCGEEIANENSYSSEKNITTLKMSYYEPCHPSTGLENEYAYYNDEYELCSTCAQEVRELLERKVK